jgi:predicted transcriptional regulator
MTLVVKDGRSGREGRLGAVKLSAGELELMSLLWREGPVSIAEAHEGLGRPVGYTTMQTRLNRLVTKGLADRSEGRPARYRALVAPGAIGGDHLDDLVERVGGGTIVPLVAHLVQSGPLSWEELDELKRLIEGAEQRLEGEEGKS